MNAKQKAYLARVSAAAAEVDATAELSAQALEALTGDFERMPAAVFRELTEKGYIVAAKRGFSLAPKAEAYRSARLASMRASLKD